MNLYHYNGGGLKSTAYDYGQTWQCLEDPAQPWAPTPAEIPEPATGLLLVGGLTALAGVARRRVVRPA